MTRNGHHTFFSLPLHAAPAPSKYSHWPPPDLVQVIFPLQGNVKRIPGLCICISITSLDPSNWEWMLYCFCVAGQETDVERLGTGRRKESGRPGSRIAKSAFMLSAAPWWGCGERRCRRALHPTLHAACSPYIAVDLLFSTTPTTAGIHTSQCHTFSVFQR